MTEIPSTEASASPETGTSTIESTIASPITSMAPDTAAKKHFADASRTRYQQKLVRAARVAEAQAKKRAEAGNRASAAAAAILAKRRKRQTAPDDSA